MKRNGTEPSPATDVPDARPDFRVAGIGASAGGITALQSLLRALPERPNLALVVIQHLMPGLPTRLPELLAKWTALPVRVAVDGMRPESNCVFVQSPEHVLTIERGAFRTRPFEGGGRRPGIDTIDAFFESLAADCGADAVAVVLSGTGADGAAGAIGVRQAGGLVLVQDPVTAMHDAMPMAVIARGAADRVLPVPELARELAACAAPGYRRPAAAGPWVSAVTQTLDAILALVRKQAGFDLSGYKPTPLLWRIQQRMDLRRVGRFEDYEALLRDDPAELEALIRGIPIHVTEFFRDPEAWDVLGRDVLDALVAERGDGPPIRAWTAACASGEEAYTLAMLLAERAQAVRPAVDFQVFATDASPEVLARAGRGAFSADAVKAIAPERMARFFYGADGAWRVKRSLREKMVFAPQDLLADPPLAGVDLVSCRNLLIYLDADAVERVVFQLHGALRSGGYLFLGKGESLPPRQRGFEPVSRNWRIYRKAGPLAQPVRAPTRLHGARHITAVPASAHYAALAHFDLPTVLIDERFQILRVYGDTARVLRMPAGPPTHDLLAQVPPSLVAELKRAVHDALAQRRAISVEGLREPSGGRAPGVRLTPLQTAEAGSAARLLVSFIARPDAGAAAPALDADTPDAATQAWTDAVRISHEELEASREELQALNQELKASNEQLNSSNEDLASANAQLQEKIAELQLQSRVLSSGAVVTLFLDEELRVRWFTPAVGALFPLVPGDAGRRITDLAQKFDDPNFVADVRAVMQAGQPREAEVRSSGGLWYLRRIGPYLDPSAAATGVAVTFADITARKLAEEALQNSQARLAADLAGTRRLYEMHTRIAGETDLKVALDEILAAACEFTRTDRGCVQLLSVDGARLQMFTWRGYAGDGPFISRFRHEGLREGGDVARVQRQRLLVEDWRSFPARQGDAGLQAMLRAEDIRAWQSTPMISRSGETLGVLSTQFRQAHRPSDEALRLVDLLAFTAADFVERHRAVQALRASEARQQFLLRLSDALRSAADPAAIQQVAMRLLGEQLLASRAFCYAAGREPGDPAQVSQQLAAGATVAVDDVGALPALTTDELQRYRRLDVRAFVAVPLVVGGEYRAGVLVQHAAPRHWTADEIALIEETAERTWAAAERARAEAALKASEQLRRIALEGGRMGTWRWDVRLGRCWGDAEFLRLWGLQPSDDGHPIARFTERMAPASAGAVEAVMASAAAPGEEFDRQLEIVAGPGAGRCIRWRGRSERETPWIINGVSFDVTERERAQARCASRRRGYARSSAQPRTSSTR